jgi:hypothetical protein
VTDEKKSEYPGIYAAYFTGASGNSLGIFLIKDGIIAGADIAGWKYDGSFSLSNDDRRIVGNIRFTIPPGEVSISGAIAGGEPLEMIVPISFPTDIRNDEFYRIETPAGPINARFDKIRDL